MSNPDAVRTVRIVTPVVKGNPDGFTEINEADYDETKHELFAGEVILATKPKTLQSSPNFFPQLNVGAAAPMPLADLVQKAYKTSGLDVDGWNALSVEQIDAALNTEITSLKAANGGAPPVTTWGAPKA